ncbi:hypothetical protein CspHIS471_0407680 [Cutaneotrichosporon sp. HIS471]|nr:hypothetical protein CspHIS471_0407680 [Cutaneotrichosporon sp. HIS471]
MLAIFASGEPAGPAKPSPKYRFKPSDESDSLTVYFSYRTHEALELLVPGDVEEDKDIKPVIYMGINTTQKGNKRKAVLEIEEDDDKLDVVVVTKRVKQEEP